MAVEEVAVVVVVVCFVAEDEVAAVVAGRWMKKCKYSFKIVTYRITMPNRFNNDIYKIVHIS